MVRTALSFNCHEIFFFKCFYALSRPTIALVKSAWGKLCVEVFLSPPPPVHNPLYQESATFLWKGPGILDFADNVHFLGCPNKMPQNT